VQCPIGRDVQADGVETEEQRDILRRLELYETPGYLFSPPVPVDRLANLLLAKGSSAAARLPIEGRGQGAGPVGQPRLRNHYVRASG
jgi:hypothetical protein